MIFGYELDGLDYEIKQGIPEPTYQDGALPNTEIIAIGLAGNYEPDPQAQGHCPLLRSAEWWRRYP